MVIKSRKVRWVGHVVCMGGMKNAYVILVGKPERKRLLRRPRSKWGSNMTGSLENRVERCGLDASGSG
jgi:hypothetical protein